LQIAESKGCQQCLWLYGEDHEITEVGAMNLFVLLRTDSGGLELVTSPLTSGIILPGVTRRSIIEMVSTWPGITVAERKITMGEVMTALAAGRLVEMFGSGTAAVVSPVGGLHYGGVMHQLPTPEEGLAARILAAMNDIYYGRREHPWAVDVEDWNIDINQVLVSNKAFLLFKGAA
jgi:branched-chain amino acid aminotransferase